MQLAERPSATITLALCAVTAIAAAAVTGRLAFEHRWHHHHHHHSHIAFDQPGCRDRIPPPAPTPPPPAQRTYDSVLADATPLFAHCFTHDARATELLVTIAPDGRVRATTSRPEPATATSRCVGAVVERLVFPPSPTTVMMRVPITPP